MTAAGDAVLAEARKWLGVTEDPPGSNGGPWWDTTWGVNYGSWCAAFVSMVCRDAGYPTCPVDGEPGFMLVSNGTVHAYETAGATASGLEAQRTLDLQPGDTVLYSWSSWEFQGGVPVIADGSEWTGWVAGDHTGIAASTVDASGYFWAVEGNTSGSGSQDNGGQVLEKQRHISTVCGWWRPATLIDGTTTPPKGWLDMLSDQQQAELYQMVQSIFWMVGNQNPQAGAETIAGKVDEIRRHAQSTYWMVGNQDPAAGSETVASDARAARANTERLLESG